LRILVVEDEARVARPLQEGSEREEYNVVVARTGEEGFFLASSAQGRIGKTPLPSVEAIALVDECDVVASARWSLAPKDPLASVGVRGPLIQNQNACEIRNIFELWQQFLGQIVLRKGSPT